MLFFIDPNNILIPPEKYNWQREDFEKEGSQHFESSMIHLGFDFSYFSLGYSFGNVHSGISIDNHIETTSSKLGKYFLTYKNHLFGGEIIYGKTQNNSMDDYEFWRYNLKLDMWDDYSFSYSLVHYTYQYPDLTVTNGLTIAFFGSYRWNHKYIFKTMLGFELFGTDGNKESHQSPYAGINVNLVF